jgi:hypothetical protein
VGVGVCIYICVCECEGYHDGVEGGAVGDDAVAVEDLCGCVWVGGCVRVCECVSVCIWRAHLSKPYHQEVKRSTFVCVCIYICMCAYIYVCV